MKVADALSGLSAVVTGGNCGIGLGIAEALGRAGADVAIWGRRAEANEAALRKLRSTNPRSAAVVCDVSDEESVIAGFAKSAAILGKVDVVVANAGIAGSAPFPDLTLSEWREVVAVNLEGAFLTFREAVRHLLGRGSPGSLIAVSSTAALLGPPHQAHYAASKGGIISLVQSLAVEFGRAGIRVNALLPGFTESEMTAPLFANPRFVDMALRRSPIGRLGKPDDIGSAAVFLADPASFFHTGQTVIVDGGYILN